MVKFADMTQEEQRAAIERKRKSQSKEEARKSLLAAHKAKEETIKRIQLRNLSVELSRLSRKGASLEVIKAKAKQIVAVANVEEVTV